MSHFLKLLHVNNTGNRSIKFKVGVGATAGNTNGRIQAIVTKARGFANFEK